ncbi:hypothetical protein [Candidatus Dactylopiibacterium carminicum]|uniref:hypothetical protein n=1 Tax=Candidatus Dactylopiibacterium carminicum TaxID=857335 RepID=UPI001483A436|nr:hypothetical protein [Candidatus Dactylopiibacterium carminicum]
MIIERDMHESPWEWPTSVEMDAAGEAMGAGATRPPLPLVMPRLQEHDFTRGEASRRD